MKASSGSELHDHDESTSEWTSPMLRDESDDVKKRQQRSRKRQEKLDAPLQMRVTLLLVILSAMSLVVPGSLTGVMIRAIDSVLISDHIPKAATSHATATAEAMQQAWLEAQQTELLQRTSWMYLNPILQTWAVALVGGTDGLDAYDVIADLDNHTSSAAAAAALMGALNVNASMRAMSSQTSSASCSGCSYRVVLFQRKSSGVVSMRALVRYNTTQHQWESTMMGEGSNSNRTGIVSSASFSLLFSAYCSNRSVGQNNTAVKTDMKVPLATAAGWLLSMDPCMAAHSEWSTRTWVPVSHRAVQQSFSALVDGLYLEAATPNAAGWLRQTAWWAAVFQASRVDVSILTTATAADGYASVSSAASVAVVAVALLHVPTMVMVGCGSRAGLSTTASSFSMAVLPESVRIASGGGGSTEVVPSVDPNSGLSLQGCQWISQYLSTRTSRDVWSSLGSRETISSPAAAQDYYFTSVGLCGTSRCSATAVQAPYVDGVSPSTSPDSDWAVVVVEPQGTTETTVIRARGQIVVIAFVVAVVTVFLLVLTIRLMVKPLHSITRAVLACVSLQLHRMEMMEASIILEISEIQRSLSYLAVRVHQYLRFFPDTSLLQRVADDDTDNASRQMELLIEEHKLRGGVPYSSSDSSSDSGESSPSDLDSNGSADDDISSVGTRNGQGKHSKRHKLYHHRHSNSASSSASSHSDSDAATTHPSHISAPPAAISRNSNRDADVLLTKKRRQRGLTSTRLLGDEHRNGTKPGGGGDVDADWSVDEAVAEKRRRKQHMMPVKAPVHSIVVDVVYESRHLNRSSIVKAAAAAKQASFIFRHRVTDPVLDTLTRQCRQHLHEHPGEVLLLFTRTGGAGSAGASPSGIGWQKAEGLRQLTSDEDVLFAIERCNAQQVTAAVATSSSSTSGSATATSSSAAASPSLTTTITIHVRKGSQREWLPLLIAVGTLASVVSRLVLSVQRLSSTESNTQVLGLLLLGCLAVQIAQNALISMYLVRRFALLDHNFREWAAVSRRDIALSIAFGALNVTNLEIMGCHVRIAQLRLSAPMTPYLRVKISKYSFVGFIVGDLLPFVFILINIVLNQLYRDPYTMVSVAFSVLSVTSILVTHGILRFVVEDTLGRAEGVGSSSGIGSGSGAGSQSHGGLGSGAASALHRFGNDSRSLMLSKRDMTLLRVAITDEEALVDVCSVTLMDYLLSQLYKTIQHAAVEAGGLLLEAHGLTATLLFNAHAVVPDHARVALQCFERLRSELERDVLAPFFTGDKFRAHMIHLLVAEGGPTAARNVANVLYHVHSRHRVVGGLLSDTMAAGYVGTLTAQTFQLVGLHSHLADTLVHMSEFYGATLLTTEVGKLLLSSDGATKGDGGRGGTTSAGWSRRTLMRRLDDLVLSDELTGEGMNGAVQRSLPPMLRSSLWLHASTTNKGGLSHHSNAAVAAAPPMLLINAPGMIPSTSSTQVAVGSVAVQPAVTVYEVVLHGFLPQTTLAGSAATSADAAAIVSSLPHAQLRRRPRSAKVAEAIESFNAAVDLWRSVRSDRLLMEYIDAHPDDHVGRRVCDWIRFKGSTNERLALAACQRVPHTQSQGGLGNRLLCSVGVSRHPCETRAGHHLTPEIAAEDAATSAAIAEMIRKTEERQQKLRPPRSERRAAAVQSGHGAGLLGGQLQVSNSGGAVIDGILRAQTNAVPSYEIVFGAASL